MPDTQKMTNSWFQPGVALTSSPATLGAVSPTAQCVTVLTTAPAAETRRFVVSTTPDISIELRGTTTRYKDSAVEAVEACDWFSL